MSGGPATVLAEVLEEAAAGLEGVERVADAGAVAYERSGLRFAVVSGPVAEFRLDPVVAAAALRTADVSESRLGPGWVRFSPGELDQFAVDRAAAWFAAAWRRATG